MNLEELAEIKLGKIPELYYIEYDGCPVMLSSGKTALLY